MRRREVLLFCALVVTIGSSPSSIVDASEVKARALVTTGSALHSGPQLSGSDFVSREEEATREDFSLWGIQVRPSPLTQVLWLMLSVMSLYFLAVLVERWCRYSQTSSQSRDFESSINAALAQNRIDDAHTTIDRFQATPLAQVVRAGLCFGEAPKRGESSEADLVEQARQRTLTIIGFELKRPNGSLLTIACIAPIVGLFGTVMGFIQTLEAFRYAEGSGISAAAGGAAEALRFLAFSLAIAAPSLWAHGCLSSRAGALVMELDASSSRLIACVRNRRDAYCQSGTTTRFGRSTRPLN